MASSTERERFISLMATQGVSYAVARLFLRHAKTHGRLQEDRCNGHPAMGNPNIPVATLNVLQERFEQALERREGQIERRLTELATNAGLKVDFQGDPRGWTVKIITRDGREYGVPQ